MDFERTLKTLLAEFERSRIRYGVIGGFALGALGIPRATMDLDFLVHREDLERLHERLAKLGYMRIVHTENVSHYRHPTQQGGSIDILHAFREATVGMLKRAGRQPLFGGVVAVNVLQPEDIIGLKVQAMSNDTFREAHEQADIESLLTVYGPRLDWSRIQEFYEVFDRGDEAKRLRQRYGHAE